MNNPVNEKFAAAVYHMSHFGFNGVLLKNQAFAYVLLELRNKAILIHLTDNIPLSAAYPLAIMRWGPLAFPQIAQITEELALPAAFLNLHSYLSQAADLGEFEMWYYSPDPNSPSA